MPGLSIVREGLPNIVTTATSDCRTWKLNSSRPSMMISRTPTAIRTGLRFIKKLFLGRLDIQLVVNVGPEFVLQIDLQNVVGVSRQQNVFAGLGRGANEC